MSDAVFIRLVHEEYRESSLRSAVESLHQGNNTTDVYIEDSSSFSGMPGSPFAYWVSENARLTFGQLPSLENERRTVRIGAGTKDDFRWLRAWWECQPIWGERRWISLNKGGQRSNYYADLLLCVDWRENGDYLGEWVFQYRPREGYRWGTRGINSRYFFRPAITWPRRTSSLSFRFLPSGSVFTDKGPSLFVQNDEPNELLTFGALMNSSVFRGLVAAQVAGVSLAHSFEVGLVQSTPVPTLGELDAQRLAFLAGECFEAHRDRDTGNEIGHCFRMPEIIRFWKGSLDLSACFYESSIGRRDADIRSMQLEIDGISSRVYGLVDGDFSIMPSRAERHTEEDPDYEYDPDESEDDDSQRGVSVSSALAMNMASFAVGCVLGRWDIRIAQNPSLAPSLQGPFDHLPVCPPGMLIGPDGLPAKTSNIVSKDWLRARPDVITLPPDSSVDRITIPDDEYPLRVDWDGILVDDEGHPDDVVGRVQEVLSLLWGDRSEAFEREACEALGVSGLRDYFRNPRRFWDFHVKTYSKSRRKAPIYWLLQSSKRSFGIWLYYHRMDADILYKVLRNYVDPKITKEHNRLADLQAARTVARSAGGRTLREHERAVDRQAALIAELEAFRETLERVARLDLIVDHDDGVLLSIAPLHELVPWKPAAQAWNELVAGKYSWSTMSKRMHEKGLIRAGRR